METPMQLIQPGLQIKRYLVKCKRKPTGDSTQPNKRSSVVVDGSVWEDITTDDSSSDSVSQLNQQPPQNVIQRWYLCITNNNN